MLNKLFEIRNLHCSYDRPYVAGQSKVVLEIRHLVLPRGKKVFIVGESGIGKSTVLEVIGMMNNTIVPDPATEFRFYSREGKETDLIRLWETGSDKELSDFRLRHFNFIFQNTNLMRNFTAYENIAITRMLQGYSREESFAKAREVLAGLGLGWLGEERLAQELSGGQQQRLAFARAILPDFDVLFGDEPTGNLDPENAMAAMELLSSKLSDMAGSSAIIVTHDMHLAILFGDVIIKVRKQDREERDEDGEIQSFGLIDERSSFVPDEGRKHWGNGTDVIHSEQFESFLRMKL